MVAGTEAHAGTRDRLIDAAGEVFAEVGFRAATVREMCRRAGANVAAVNYHFRDKEELYQEVFRQAHCAADEVVKTVASLDGLAPKEQLGHFIESFLHNLLVSGRPTWHGKLMAREMIEPTAALDYVVRTAIRPRFDLLRSIVRKILGPGHDEDDVRFAAASVIGQCLFWKHAEPVVKRLYPDVSYDAPRVKEIADRATEFSWAALNGLRNRVGARTMGSRGAKK